MKLRGNGLKWIAMAAMLIDHIGLVILQYWVAYGDGNGVLGRMLMAVGPDVVWKAARGMRAAGRVSFPVYAFLLTEGFIHTRDWRKYLLRMLVFAAVSEIPFSLAAYNGWVGGSRNVFVELAAGLLMLQGFKKAEACCDARRGPFMLLVFGAAGVLAWIVKADYGITGMGMIAAFYLLRHDRATRVWSGCLISFVDTLGFGMGAGILAVIPLMAYNGEKGRTGNRYVFYWFYPLHLLALFVIRSSALGIPLM